MGTVRGGRGGGPGGVGETTARVGDWTGGVGGCGGCDEGGGGFGGGFGGVSVCPADGVEFCGCAGFGRGECCGDGECAGGTVRFGGGGDVDVAPDWAISYSALPLVAPPYQGCASLAYDCAHAVASPPDEPATVVAQSRQSPLWSRGIGAKRSLCALYPLAAYSGGYCRSVGSGGAAGSFAGIHEFVEFCVVWCRHRSHSWSVVRWLEVFKLAQKICEI